MFDNTDHLIMYLVDRMEKGDRDLGLKPNRGVLTTALAKLLFLVDVLAVQATSKKVTDLQYIRYKFGPYPLVQFEERLSNLEGRELVRQPGVSIEGNVYGVFRLGQRPRFRPTLTGMIRLVADEVLTEFGNQRLDEILEHVYSLDVVRRCAFGDLIPLESLGPVGVGEGDLVSKVAKFFSNALLAPLPEAHLNALREAAREETNENIRIADAMRDQQRQAFQRKAKD